MELFNKNEKQHNFNQIKGAISEINDGEKFCSLTLEVGHEKPRPVNLVVKKQEFDSMLQGFNIGDKVMVKFYLSSRKKNQDGGRQKWATMANILSIERI